MTETELETVREKLKSLGDFGHIQSPYENLSFVDAERKIATGEKAVVRFKTRSLKKDYILKDLIRGEVKFPSDMVGDFVLLRSDGMPVYNFCCVVDDYLMKISHVLRAEEHLPNTLRQLMVYEAMNWPIPQFGHMSLVLNEDRQKLSKRSGAASCDQFRTDGYLPEAMNNFLALLGWSSPDGKEILSLPEMIKAFSIERLNPAGAIFDRIKLKWMNAQHLRARPNAEIWKLILPYLQKADLKLPEDSAWQIQSVEMFKSKMELLADAVLLYTPLDDTKYEIAAESLEILKMASSKLVLEAWLEAIKNHAAEVVLENDFLKIQDEVKLKSGQKGKNLFFPIRIAIIGKPHGSELQQLVPLLAKKSIITRAQKALEQC